MTLLLLSVAVGPAGEDHGVAPPRPAEPALLGQPGRAGERTGHARDRGARGGAARHPDDRDLTYLLGAEYKKAGRYDDASGLYREALLRSRSRDDPIALNNLANIEFARGEFPAAIARYKQGIESGPPTPIAATFYYNLSLAHLQRFEYQPAQEARSQADRLDSCARALVRQRSGSTTRATTRSSTSGSPRTRSWAKFAGARPGRRCRERGGQGRGRGHGAGARCPRLATASRRSCSSPCSRWPSSALARRARMFTMRCLKCGTPFCQHCHLGRWPRRACARSATTCSWCATACPGPARNQKLLEVQKEDERRERVFRALSLLSPGAGHLYAHQHARGDPRSSWSGRRSSLAALLAGRVLPGHRGLGRAARSPGGWASGALVLLVVYVARQPRTARLRERHAARPPRRGAARAARRRAS